MAKAQRIVVTFSIILLVILLGSTIYAVFTEDNGAPFRVMSLRGEQVEIYGGNGLHAYDTVDKAIMMRAFDMYYLTVGIPLFIISLLLYIRRSIIGYFMLLSSLFFWLYNFIINSVGFSYNNFFLIYIIVNILSILAVVFLVMNISFDFLSSQVLPRLPVRRMSVFVLLLASYFIISWLAIDLKSLFTGTVHPDLDIYTTAELNITDLNIYVPFSIAASVLMMKKKPLGIILSVGIILLAIQEMTALSFYTFLKIDYLKESIEKIELPIILLVPICLIIGVNAMYKLKGMKYVPLAGSTFAE